MTIRTTRRRLLATGATAGAWFVDGRAGAAQSAVGDDITARLAAVIAPYAAAGRFGGAVLVARGGETLLRAGYGVANRISGAPNTPETAYQIASLTKAFTALACVQLELAGALALDDPVTAHLPEVVYGERDGVALTIRHLLSHTGGVPDFLGFYDAANPLSYPRTFDRLLADILARELEFVPGTRFAYGNSGYILAGLIVERASGMPFEAYLKDRIFGPAGMTRSYIAEPPEPAPPGAKGYLRLDGQWVAISDFGRVDLAWAAGGISSTIDDLRHWHEALLTESLAPRVAIDAMYVPILNGYGLGWEMGALAGRPVVGHGGQTVGYTTSLARFLEDGVLIVLLSNVQDAPKEEIVAALAGALFA